MPARNRRLSYPPPPDIRHGGHSGRFYPYMVKVASHSYIHGLKEVYSSRTMKEKVFWVAVCVLCCAAAIYEITQIVILYREKGIATKIHIHSVSTVTYPTLLMCPTKWMSKRRVKELEVDWEAAQYLLSIFEAVVPIAVRDLSFPQDLNFKLRQALDKTHSKTLADLAVNLSISADNFKCDPSCCKNIAKRATVHGVCFVVDLCKSSFQSRHKSPNILLTINATDAYGGMDMLDGGILALYSNRNKTQNYEADDDQPFQNWPETTTMCEFDCLDKTENRICFNCSKYSMFKRRYSLPPCQVRRLNAGGCTPDARLRVERRLRACKRHCLPWCRKTIYVTQGVTALNFPKSHVCGADVKMDCMQAIIYFPSFTEWEYEDVETINIDTFISSIGGQTGLWCGASVVSLCQLISYFCCPCLHWADSKSSYYNKFKTSNAKNGKNKSHPFTKKGWNPCGSASISSVGGVEVPCTIDYFVGGAAYCSRTTSRRFSEGRCADSADGSLA